MTLIGSQKEAYAQFDALFAMYGGVTTDSSGIDPKKSGSFEELDEYLLALSELPADIAVELQRRGIANTGKPKRTLNLQYETGLVSRILGPRKDSLKLARIHYESYAKETRMGALRDMRDRIASRYLTSELLSSILMSDRVKRDAYMTQVRAGYTPDISISNYMETQATVAAEPLIAFRVRFVDQTGREVSGMPYEASVRGVLNYKEALLKTNMGANPGAFSSGKMLTEQGMTGGAATDTTNGGQVENWRGRSLDPTYEYHLLYPYRARGKGGTPRGTVKVSITTPRNVNSTADWGNDRLKVYEEVANASEKRDANLTNPSPKMLLYSHNYKLEEGGDPERMVITVPIYIEPLPMHLIESPPGSGNIVSKWSIAEDIGAIPSHQKIPLTFTVLRPKASEAWEQADNAPPSTRDGWQDKFLQYSEFTSPQGRAAYREAEREASPVRGIRFVLMPDRNNTWTTAKKPIFMQPDFMGVMTAEVVPGKYKLNMLIEIKGDGTTGLRLVTSSNDPDHPIATRYDQLSPTLQSAVSQKYPESNISASTLFTPEIIQMGILEAPAGFYYRETNSEDTTPVGAVGVKLFKSGNMQDTGSSRFRNFELKTKIPPLLTGKEIEPGSIYDLLYVDTPAIVNGWPVENTDTDDRVFDTATLLLSPDSSVDLSMLSAYEQRYEAERDAGGETSTRLKPPLVGTRVAYMGYWIEHAWFDSAIGPDLKNSEMAFGGGVHEYEMGRLETPFYDEGVIRLMCYYPQSGVLRRRMMVQGNQEPNPSLVESAVHAYTRHNYQYSSPDRVYHFQVESGPEGAILSGRWCPIEVIGLGNGEDNVAGFLDIVFNEICAEIRRGGGPFLGVRPRK